MEMIGYVIVGALIMLIGVIIGFAFSQAKYPKEPTTTYIDTSNWPKEFNRGDGSGEKD